jgi:hypothetical protein
MNTAVAPDPRLRCLVVSQNSSRDQNGTVLAREGPNTTLASKQHEDFGGERKPCAPAAQYMLMGGKSIRTRPLGRNDGAARRVGPEKGLDPKLLNEFCCSVFPSQVRNACGPHGGNEHTPRAIASDGVHSAQTRGPAGLGGSFRSNAPPHRFARDSRRKFAPGSFPKIGLPLEAPEHTSHLDRKSETWEWN